MGSYSSDDEALIGLARQLTDAYAEARTREDQDYACDEIAAFLAAQRLEAPSEALLAILDLPLTAETYPLVDEAQSTLARRGPAVVELLLEAVLGDVYDPDGPAPERAAEALDLMDRREAAQGLTEVLCGRGDDQFKGAAVDGLVTLGALAEPSLAATLDDPRGGEWAQAALRQIRFARDHPGVADDEGPDEAGGACDESFVDDYGPADEAGDDETAVGETYAGERDADVDAGATEGAAAGEAGDDGVTGQGPAAEGSPASPDQGVVDDAYKDFLRRFEQDSGGAEPAS